MCLNIGTHKTIDFPFGTNGKLMVLGVPILEHIRVCTMYCKQLRQWEGWRQYLILGIWVHLHDMIFCPFFTKGNNFLTSYLLPLMKKPILK